METILITGGCGFIGFHTAMYFSQIYSKVVVIDNLSRKGTEHNLKSLLENRSNIEFHNIDISDSSSVFEIVGKIRPNALIHLAAQAGIPVSIREPLYDFRINCGGTLNLLEAIRIFSPDTHFLYASTNKVYGDLQSIQIEEREKRYVFSQQSNGINETQNLDFHSPYGCSKGCGDQYVRDYARIYKLYTTVLRQSCIYGPNQFGVTDQGWLTWFFIASQMGKKLTFFGNGKQTRDMLFVTDLVNAYSSILSNREKTKGEVFNVGGGATNSLSLLESVELIERILDRRVAVDFSDPRPGDQRLFISDNDKLSQTVGWLPKITLEDGTKKTAEWIQKDLIKLNHLYSC